MKKLKTFILREIAGDHILVPTGKTTLEFNGMITFTETAAFLWEHLEKAADLRDLVRMLRTEYAIDEPSALRDAQALIDQMRTAGMIDYTDAALQW